MATPIYRVRSAATSFDFFPYTRVGQGEGLDPVDGGKLRGVFADAVGEGAPLLQITAANREMLLPVHLNAGSAAGLPSLVAVANQVLADGRLVEWQDGAATLVTYLDPLMCRFEPAFDYRRAAAGYLSGNVRLTTKPYGHTGTSRVVASAVGTAGYPWQIATLGALAGDAPAQLDVTIAGASGLALSWRRFDRVAAVSVLPSGFDPWVPPASLTATNVTYTGRGATVTLAFDTNGATLIGASGVPASQYLQVNGNLLTSGTEVAFAVLLPTTTPYAGRNRVLAMLQGQTSGSGALWAAHARDQADTVIGPTAPVGSGAAASGALVPASGFQLVDLGVLTVSPSSVATPMLRICMNSQTGITAGNPACAGVLLLPEDSTHLLVDGDAGAGQPTYTFKHTGQSVVRDEALNIASAGLVVRKSMDSARRGAFPAATPGYAARVFSMLIPQGLASNVDVAAEVRVRERFQYFR